MTIEKKQYSLAELYPLITETLDRGDEFRFVSAGVSMTPMLGNKTHTVCLRAKAGDLHKNDIPLVRRDDGSFVLHRVIGRDKTGYILCGDHQVALEHGIKDDNVVGVLTAYICPDGRRVEVSTDPAYKRYVRRLSVTRPLKRIYHRIRVILGLSKE